MTTGLFSGLTELKFVSISAYNKKTTASGVIPQDICISGKLEQLELSHLTLAGSIPLKLMQCSSLKIIRIYNCGISGPLPSDFSKLSNLEILELSFN